MPAAEPAEITLRPAQPKTSKGRWRRRLVVLTFFAFVVGIPSWTALQVGRHLGAAARLRAHHAQVIWEVDRKTLSRGGRTEVRCATARESISDADLRELETLFDVVAVDLSGCRLVTDAGLESVARLNLLEELYLGVIEDSGRVDRAPIHDAGLAKLAGLDRLKVLVLQGADVTDQGLPSLLRLRSLEYVDLSATRVSAEGIEVLKGLPRLRTLRIERLGLSPEQSRRLQQTMNGVEIIDDTPTLESMVRMKRKVDY